MTDNFEKFRRDLHLRADGLPKRLLIEKQRKIAISAFNKLTLRTPVDTGRARGNWQLTFGEKATDEVPASGWLIGLEEALGILEDIRELGTVFISNNVPYIVPLEEGHSQQASDGIVRPVFDELKAELSGGQI